jgi:nanoRNase/pAp phosphatase (c-di-AMP/oligoRNAs hydrolase)
MVANHHTRANGGSHRCKLYWALSACSWSASDHDLGVSVHPLCAVETVPMAQRNSDPAERLAKLSAVLEGARSMLIVLQNNPDPDAIAAATALREIANELHGIACSVAHGGTVGRAENKALVRYLGLNTRSIDAVEVERFDRVAMVDAQPGAGNVQLDPSLRVDIVIDHHPIRRETRSAKYTDIRRRYGATSTILFEYVMAAGIDITPPLATALVYGIRSDTQDLGRESTKADVAAFLHLYPLANARVLGRIVSAPVPRSHFAMLRRALDNATVHGTRIVSYLSQLANPEIIAEAADLLLRVEDATWSMCLGVSGGVLHISLRGSEREPRAGTIARKLAGRRGQGGGHDMVAAVQIPLADDDLADRRRLDRLIGVVVQRFLRATGTANEPGVPLCAE